MNRTSRNASKTKRLNPAASKQNRKSYHDISDSSSISSNRNSSAHSEEEVSGVYLRPQVDKNVSLEEQEQVTKKLQGKVKELRHKLRILEESVDSKDYSLGTIAREKDRAIGEIRRLERSNKLLRQQLNDERNHYLREKEKFCEEMTKYKKKLQEVKSETEGKKPASAGRRPLINSLKWDLSNEMGDFEERKQGSQLKKSKTQKTLQETKPKSRSDLSLSGITVRKPSSIESLHLYEGDDVSLQLAALRTENAKLRSIICERDEQNYDLCLRFLRMKHYKNDIKSRFQDLEAEYLQVIANLMDKIDEARQEFNFIIDQKFKRPLHSTNAMYLQMVQKNSRMAFENASLRLENQCLKKELNKHGNERKSEFRTNVTDDLESKLIIEDEKTETNLKITKKNVNFNEVRTIYERYMTFRNSDTDSNYMSKTSTTGPSVESVGDPKSNESILEEENSSQKEIQYPLQPNTLPDAILKKIFKRIDIGYQTVDTERSKEQTENEIKSPQIEGTSKPDPTTEQKSPLANSSPSESKESVGHHQKPKWKPEHFRRKGDQSLKTRLGVQCDWKFDMDSEGSSSLDFPLRRFILSGKKPKKPPEAPQKRFQDSCGLQEKLEFSDMEQQWSSSIPGVSNQTTVELQSRQKPDVIDSEEDLREKLAIREEAKNSESRNSNKPNLLDDLTEMQKIDASSWEREKKLQPTQSGASNSRNQQCDSLHEQRTETQRKPEASKRFSHRLISTSPEKLKSMLTDSQLGAFQTSPVIVGHATTEIDPTCVESSSETFLPSPSAGHSAVFSAKETSLYDLSSICFRKSLERTEACASDVRIPISSVPTSSSTMEILDSTAFERSNVMTRTLSAPGLLESNWLDPYTICEMRDCGTNT